MPSVNIRQEYGNYSQQRKEGAYLKYEFYARFVGKPSEKGRSYTSKTEIKAEKQSCHHTDFIGF